MAKIAIGARTLLYPLPSVLVGATVDGKVNFSTYAWCGIVNSRPPMLSVAFQHHRHTLKGVKQNGTFSVNIPSVGLVKETDYCGLVSGRETDKVADCKFEIFYGKLSNAPMIVECPVNLECRVIHILNLGSHEMVVGQIEEAYVTDVCLTNGEPDVSKIKPFLWVTQPASQYWTFGEPIGESFSIGKIFREREGK
ncbi:MAG: flavin reductase family protein [Dehalococcoidales bacterium]|nr:flavin reductase family protein [Dehalococcoidales bacterium]